MRISSPQTDGFVLASEKPTPPPRARAPPYEPPFPPRRAPRGRETPAQLTEVQKPRFNKPGFRAAPALLAAPRGEHTPQNDRRLPRSHRGWRPSPRVRRQRQDTTPH